MIQRVVLFLCLCTALWAGTPESGPSLVVLGIAQDAGYPQAGCSKPCCQRVLSEPKHARLPTCLALLDGQGQGWLLEATPAFPQQLQRLNQSGAKLAGIFLSHGHMGHYTGLMFLGREVMGAHKIPVHAMPRMRAYLRDNGPWSQLVRLNNISLNPMEADTAVKLSPELTLTPFLVPHRDEFTETVGFLIEGPRKKIAFIPDIDKWSRWDRNIEALIKRVDLALLDGTFFAEGEIPGRNMAEIPHPFIAETMARLAKLPAEQRAKVRFIHFNHTNPILVADSPARRRVIQAGFTIAEEGDILAL